MDINTPLDGYEFPAQRKLDVDLSKAEVREADDGTITFEGYAAVFDKRSRPLGVPGAQFREVLARGVFRKALSKQPDVKLLFNHNTDALLARTTSGTLSLKEDAEGLKVRADIAPTSYAKDLKILMQRGDLSEMSFAFTVENDEARMVDGEVIRTVFDIKDLSDVSIVTDAAYPQTSLAVRSVLGVDIAEGETVNAEALRDIAGKIFRGEVEASDEDKATIDSAFEQLNEVSPWKAQQVIDGYAQAASARGTSEDEQDTDTTDAVEPGSGDTDTEDDSEVRAAAIRRAHRLRLLELGSH